jgi:hypothetical protein
MNAETPAPPASPTGGSSTSVWRKAVLAGVTGVLSFAGGVVTQNAVDIVNFLNPPDHKLTVTGLAPLEPDTSPSRFAPPGVCPNLPNAPGFTIRVNFTETGYRGWRLFAVPVVLRADGQPLTDSPEYCYQYYEISSRHDQSGYLRLWVEKPTVTGSYSITVLVRGKNADEVVNLATAQDTTTFRVP